MTPATPKSVRLWALVVVACATQTAWAEKRVDAPSGTAGRTAATNAAAPVNADLSVVDWLQRMHTASRQRSYIGTFVVSAATTGTMSSSRIWHVCEGNLQVERIDSLSGPERSTFRRNNHVSTFFTDAKVVRTEKRESLDLFPGLPGAPDSTVGNFYTAKVLGKDRVAGLEADVVQLDARDRLRYGYRVWSERQSGLVMKLQTLDAERGVVEQSAFSELQLDPPIKAVALTRMMERTAGYKVEQSDLQKTTAEREGWGLKASIPGFKPVSCHKRGLAVASERSAQAMQWTFSDGLASVSLFIEPVEPSGALPQEGAFSIGATNTISRKLAEKSGHWWVTVVGEVPMETLNAFASALKRLP